MKECVEEICPDNRFEIIEAAKKNLIETTNIETSPDEMKVLDSILFRMWQKKWLPGCKPLRNCDIGTAEEQAIRFHKYCSRQSQDDILCLGCPLFGKEEQCEFVWAQMPYEEGKTDEQ